MAVYQYSQLEAHDAIRIIDLHPSPDLESQVNCSVRIKTLTEFNLDTIDHYNALSYVWGSPSQPTKILVDDCEMEVTQNLESALRHIRDPSRVRSMWVDAICINQQDDTEKSVQVMQMWKVYQVAQHTLIYLGEASPESDEMMKNLRSHRASFQSSITALQAADILNRPWFTRVWILQELVFSSSPWVYCGRLSIRWKDLYDAIVEIESQIGSERFFLIKQMDSSRNIRMSRDERQPIIPKTFLENLVTILRSRRGLGVQDARDMIFAHVGMAGINFTTTIDHAFWQSFSVDYRKTKSEVYEGLTIAIIVHDNNYEILRHAETAVRLEERSLKSPTWIPDWTVSSRWPLLHIVFEARNLKNRPWPPGRFAAHKYIKNITTTLCGSSSILACVGCELGHIEQIFPDLSTLDHDRALEIWSWIHNRSSWKGLEVMWHLWDDWLFSTYAGNKDSNQPPTHGPNNARNRSRQHVEYLASLPGFGREAGVEGFMKLVHGRRLATLNTGVLALVPGISCPGDIVSLFNGNLVSFVLRVFENTTQNDNIVLKHIAKVGNEQSTKGRGHAWRMGSGSVTHCRFVGECLVGDNHDSHDGATRIFALH